MNGEPGLNNRFYRHLFSSRALNNRRAIVIHLFALNPASGKNKHFSKSEVYVCLNPALISDLEKFNC